VQPRVRSVSSIVVFHLHADSGLSEYERRNLRAANFLPCPWKRRASSISSECWQCAKEIVCGLRRYWGWLRSERDRSGKGGRRVSRRRFEHWHAVKYHQRLCRNWPCALLTSHCTTAKFLPSFRAKRGISLRFRRRPQPKGKQRTWRATVSSSVRIYSQNRASGAVRKGHRQRQAFAR
jgi:hypothetical protein